jgi:hypothetical protein
LARHKDLKKARVLPFPKNGIDLSGGKVSNIDINASSAKRPAALSEDELRVRVQRIVLYGTVRESWHSKNDRSYRNVSMDDIQHMLRSAWKLAGKPKWNDEHWNWAYKLDGEDLDDDELTLIIAVHDEQVEILVITKY